LNTWLSFRSAQPSEVAQFSVGRNTLARHELASEIGHVYQAMVEASAVKRMAPPDEIASAAAFLLGPDAGFITGSDLLIDGGVIAAMRAGKLVTPA